MNPMTIVGGVAAIVLSAAIMTAFAASRPAAAVENSYVRGFFAGDRASRDWCKALEPGDKAIVASTVSTWLDLDASQRAVLGDLINAAETALAGADALCRETVEAQKSMPLPDQVAVLRRQAVEAGEVLHAIEQPLDDFYAILSEEQRATLARHMGEDRGGRTVHRGRYFGLH
jgi:Spy/CpxP family protein refolding chaperone